MKERLNLQTFEGSRSIFRISDFILDRYGVGVLI